MQFNLCYQKDEINSFTTHENQNQQPISCITLFINVKETAIECKKDRTILFSSAAYSRVGDTSSWKPSLQRLLQIIVMSRSCDIFRTMDICNIEGVKDEQTIMVHACKFAAHYNCSNV